LGEASNELNKALTELSEQDFSSKEIEFALRYIKIPSQRIFL